MSFPLDIIPLIDRTIEEKKTPVKKKPLPAVPEASSIAKIVWGKIGAMIKPRRKNKLEVKELDAVVRQSRSRPSIDPNVKRGEQAKQDEPERKTSWATMTSQEEIGPREDDGIENTDVATSKWQYGQPAQGLRKEEQMQDEVVTGEDDITALPPMLPRVSIQSPAKMRKRTKKQASRV